ncbi:MAG: HAD family hydrolase [Phycisphaeraceae bacterium]|nr:HAD family hydrolase [Phycisphaeraceae bacterium]
MPTLLTIDLWDTLLRRRCHPEEVKLATARTLLLTGWGLLRHEYRDAYRLRTLRVEAEVAIGAERKATGLDDEYEIEEVLRRWLLHAMDPAVPPGRADAIARSLANTEVMQEIAVSYPDPRAASLTTASPADVVAGISDFYLGEPRLRRILNAIVPHARIDRVFASCDACLHKRSGRLFTHVQRECLAEPTAHLHVGDHPWSDVESPRRLGINAIHYAHPDEDAKRAAHRARFDARTTGDFAPTAALLTRRLERECDPPRGLTARQADLYAAGFRAAPLYAGLALSAIEEAMRAGLPSVHYFTREGEFLAQVHEQLAAHWSPGSTPPHAVVLEVSRLSTFFPSLREVSRREMMRLWNQYSRQSPAQMLASLGLDAFPFEPLLERHALPLEPVIEHPWKDARVRSLFSDRLFRRLVEQSRDRRRRDLLAYLAQRGLTPETTAAVIVDLGWRGTIQDNIAHLLPHTTIHGWYLGLFRRLNEQPPNARKRAFGPDALHDAPETLELIRWVSPLEMLANTATGSVRGYKATHEGIAAVRAQDPGEDRVWHVDTRHFQRGVLDAAPIVADWARTHAVFAHEMRPLALACLRSLAITPPRSIAKAFFSLTHNETFGVGGFVRKPSDLPWRIRRLGLRSGGRHPKFRAHVERSAWPHGLLRLHRLDRLADRYAADCIEDARLRGGAHLPPDHAQLEAKRQITDLETSRAWQIVQAIKGTPFYRAAARARFGPGWDDPDDAPPSDRLRRIESSRAYRAIVCVKSSAVYRALRPDSRRRRGARS